MIVSAFQALTSWPEGTYTLPRPITGCPPEWKEGMRYQDTENVLNSNKKSKPFHLSGSVDVHGIRQEFCTKMDANKGKGDWPSGQYCIYRYGARCPVGFKEGNTRKSLLQYLLVIPQSVPLLEVLTLIKTMTLSVGIQFTQELSHFRLDILGR